MSFLKFKSLVVFIKIVVKLLLLRPFGNFTADVDWPKLNLRLLNQAVHRVQ